VVSPVRCRKCTAIGNDDYRTGLIFCFFSIKGKEKETILGNASINKPKFISYVGAKN